MKLLDLLQNDKNEEFLDNMSIDDIASLPQELPKTVKNKQFSHEELILNEIMRDDLVKYMQQEGASEDFENGDYCLKQKV